MEQQIIEFTVAELEVMFRELGLDIEPEEIVKVARAAQKKNYQMTEYKIVIAEKSGTERDLRKKINLLKKVLFVGKATIDRYCEPDQEIVLSRKL